MGVRIVQQHLTFESRFGVEDGWQLGVLDLHVARGFLGRGARLSRDGRDLLADEAHPIHSQHRHVL